MYKNNMIAAIALWRTPKGHCTEAKDSVRRREILLPSKRPMTEERESAPNQAPDTDQATHQRPPQASLARRYMGKLLANIATVPVYLIMEAVLPRALGPQVYGNFNFSTSVFTQLTGFLDMGTSTCFYNALSRRQYEMPLVAFYGRVSALVFLVTMLAGVFLLVPGLGDMLLPDVPLWYAPLAAFYGFLLWGTRVVRSMNDALGLTVPGELLRSGVNLLGAIIILALFWFGFLNAGSLFGLQYLMMGSIVIGCLAIMRRSWAHIDLSLTRDQRLSYTREFSDYSMPLFVQALLSALALSAERWVLQWFDGSTQQGYFALSQRVSAACFLFVSAMTPLIMRELAIAWGKDDREHMGRLLTRFAPLLFGIAAWFSCFTAVEASVLVHIFGGAEFAAALVPRADHGPISGPSGLRATSKLRFPCHRQDQSTAEPCLYRALRRLPPRMAAGRAAGHARHGARRNGPCPQNRDHAVHHGQPAVLDGLTAHPSQFLPQPDAARAHPRLAPRNRMGLQTGDGDLFCG